MQREGQFFGRVVVAVEHLGETQRPESTDQEREARLTVGGVLGRHATEVSHRLLHHPPRTGKGRRGTIAVGHLVAVDDLRLARALGQQPVKERPQQFSVGSRVGLPPGLAGTVQRDDLDVGEDRIDCPHDLGAATERLICVLGGRPGLLILQAPVIPEVRAVVRLVIEHHSLQTRPPAVFGTDLPVVDTGLKLIVEPVRHLLLLVTTGQVGHQEVVLVPAGLLQAGPHVRNGFVEILDPVPVRAERTPDRLGDHTVFPGGRIHGDPVDPRQRRFQFTDTLVEPPGRRPLEGNNLLVRSNRLATGVVGHCRDQPDRNDDDPMVDSHGGLT